MRFLWLPVLIVSFNSLVSSVKKDLNPCDAIDKTDTNLSDVVVLFVNFEWKIVEKNFTNISLAIFDAWTRREFMEKEETLSSLPELMENFVKCYGRDSGLQVKNITFEKRMNATEDCVLRITENMPKKSDFSKKHVKIIESPDVLRHCGQPRQVPLPVWNLVQEASSATEKRIAFCHWSDLEKLIHAGFYSIVVDWNTRFYEVMEDEVNNLKLDVFTRRQDFEIKYSYFTTIPRTPVVWSSFVAVLTVISFFVLGLILCCCSLMSFGLVEEDFERRNEERNWIARNVRRNLQRDYVISPAPVEEDEGLATAISKGSASRSSMETAKSSSNVSTDSTQPSDTISGTTHTNLTAKLPTESSDVIEN
ncbi:hypothetical protein CRE_12907 [Caenorhabditis remanei]|uniref:Uncharacterized protein n=1 Tax=Caenorhabditis remanei TaxID=31234 RepID=E3MQW8_CAERE|nr:hypothetical protein CRE_12907 [Caenorhabditis remanei]